jgi:hypothetical protein
VEAWLLKKPVVAADSGGVPELVKEGYNGLLYEPGNYAQLALKIGHLIDNKNIMMELGQNGYDYSRTQFTEQKYGGEVYKSLINLKKGPRQSSPVDKFLVNVAGQVITAEDAELNRLMTDLEAKEIEIKQANTELGSIKNSLTWRSVVRYQSFVDKTMPLYTRRRAVYEKIFALVRKS